MSFLTPLPPPHTWRGGSGRAGGVRQSSKIQRTQKMTARTLAIVAVLAIAATATAQYRPKSGEVVMRLTLESKAQIDILLHTKEAPRATAHVIDLVQKSFYNGQSFFRVVKEPRPFLVQFGDPATKSKPFNDKSIGDGGSGTSVSFEDSGFANVTGAVGLATKKGDKDSGDSQFYILLSDSRFLNGSATIFGNVVGGMDTVKGVALGDKVSSVSIVRG